jgi:hypothetical protein
MALYREQQLTQQNLHIKAAMNQRGAMLVLSVVFEMLEQVNHHIELAVSYFLFLLFEALATNAG